MKSPIALRRELHRHPELSFCEEQSARRIGEALTEAGIAWQPIAQTGILARIEGQGDRKKAVVLRADIDALPLEEECEVAWRSEQRGVMHACGHDMHAAMLYGTLLKMQQVPFEGTLFGLFQPGEECNPGGAIRVLQEEPFAHYQIQAVVGQHVEPTLEVGSFGFRAGKYMAANDELHLRITGRGGHAAMRHAVQDTVSAVARLVLDLTALNRPDRILSMGRVEALGATNVIPSEVLLQGTMRTFTEEEREALKQEIRQIVTRFQAREAMQCALEIRAGYPAVVNHEGLTRIAQEVARREGKRVEELPLRTTSEDFGWYGTRYPSLFYRIGVGPDAGATHTPTFNPREEAIEEGISLMTALAREFLER